MLDRAQQLSSMCEGFVVCVKQTSWANRFFLVARLVIFGSLLGHFSTRVIWGNTGKVPQYPFIIKIFIQSRKTSFSSRFVLTKILWNGHTAVMNEKFEDLSIFPVNRTTPAFVGSFLLQHRKARFHHRLDILPSFKKQILHSLALIIQLSIFVNPH